MIITEDMLLLRRSKPANRACRRSNSHLPDPSTIRRKFRAGSADVCFAVWLLPPPGLGHGAELIGQLNFYAYSAQVRREGAN